MQIKKKRSRRRESPHRGTSSKMRAIGAGVAKLPWKSAGNRKKRPNYRHYMPLERLDLGKGWSGIHKEAL